MSELIRAYEKYRSKRAQIKERQRADLERELEDYAVEVGRAILKEREQGASIDDITGKLGNKNRNYVYAMISYAKGFDAPEAEPEAAEPGAGALTYYVTDNGPGTYIVSLYRYTETGRDEWAVTLHTDKYGKVIDMPDDWWMGASKEDKAVYKEIIQTIEE